MTGGRAGSIAAVAALLALMAARVVHVAWVTGPTFDEPKHLSTGLAYLASGVCCLGRDNTPLVALPALPLYLRGELPQLAGADVKAAEQAADPADLLRPRYFRARLMQLPLVLLLGLAVHGFMRAALGPLAALLALALLAVEPNLTAFAAIVSPDFQVAALLLGACAAAAPIATCMLGVRRTIAIGVLFGLAVLAKYTALLFAPALLLVALAAPLRRTNAPRALAALALGGLVVLAAYEIPRRTHGLAGVLPPRFADRAAQEKFAGLDATLVASDEIGFFPGLAEVRRNAAVGFPTYFFGAVANRFALFYPALVLFKTPLALLLLAPLGLVLWLRTRACAPLYPLLATAAILLGAAVASHFNLGIRHVLLLMPLGACLAAAALVLAPGRAWASAAFVALAAIAGFRHHPDHLAYFNELIGGPDGASRSFADSSYDWGQDLWKIRAAARRLGIAQITGYLHAPGAPAEYGVFVKAPPKGAPPTGWCAVSHSRLMGLGKQDYEGYRVADLFAGALPVARIGRTISLYLRSARR